MHQRKFTFAPLLNCLLSSSLLGLFMTSCACSDSSSNRVAKYIEAQNQNTDVAMVTDVKSVRHPAATKAVAIITPYKDHKVLGEVTFTKVDGGIRILANVDGLKPGKHGFHVHEHGDCSGEDGMKAGGHFNPTNTKHGGPDSPERHVGDFGNLEADENGHAHYDRVDTLIAFEGQNSILGRTIIIHADPDDFVTQPTGASGARIACAKIEAIANPSKKPASSN